MKRFFLACSGLAFSSAVFANSFSLQDALSTAEDHSPRIQQAASVREEAYWEKVENRSTFLPTITGNAQYVSDYKYLYTDLDFNGSHVSIPGIVPTSLFELDAQWVVFEGFAGVNRVRAATTGERAAERELEWTRFETDRQVTLLFYKALAARILRSVSEANLKTLEDHLHDVTLLKRSGMGTNYDLLRVEVQVDEARADLLNSIDEIETANANLAERLGLEAVAEPQGNLPELPPTLVDKLEPKAGTPQRADVLALQDRVEAARLKHLAEAVHWVPKVSLFGQYQYYNNLDDRIDDWSRYRNAYELGVRLTWNLFEGFAAEARAREAAEKTVQNEKTLRMAQLKAAQDIALWKRKYKYFYSVYKSRQSDIGKARESVRLAREGRRVGSRTTTDMLDAETDLHRAEAGSVQAQVGLIEALINLELSTGRKLYEFN